MNNLDCVLQVLAAHREGRRWTDEAVAMDLLARLQLEPYGEVGAGAEAMALVAEARAGRMAEPVVEVVEPEPEPVAETAPDAPDGPAIEPAEEAHDV